MRGPAHQRAKMRAHWSYESVACRTARLGNDALHLNNKDCHFFFFLLKMCLHSEAVDNIENGEAFSSVRLFQP